MYSDDISLDLLMSCASNKDADQPRLAAPNFQASGWAS